MARAPTTNKMALRPPTITRLQGNSPFRMGAAPVSGKASTIGAGVGAGGEAQIGPVMVLESNVTEAADSAKNRPFKVALVFMALTPVCEKMFPMTELVVPRVVELPTLHHTLQASPPVTDEPGPKTSVDTVLKIQTPDPVRFRFPAREKLLVEQ